VRDTHARGRAWVGDLIDRRVFLNGAFASLATFFLSLLSPPFTARAGNQVAVSSKLSAELESKLRVSEYVYISPLRKDGQESTCHGEVWYDWIDGSVVMITSKKTWKARSLEKGLDRARIWVGDYGRWKAFFGHNDDFQQGLSFHARASTTLDEKLFERMLTTYETKYPEEIADWRDKMRSGFRDGTRILIRYTPV